MADFGLWGARRMPAESRGTALRTLEEMLEDLDIIEVNPDYIIATKFAHPLVDEDQQPIMRELGKSGTKWSHILGGREYNAELRGRTGLRTYERMRRSDGTVGQSLKIAKTPVLQAEWWVDPWDPENDQAVQQAEFVSKALFQWQSIGWTQFMSETLTMLDFGYSLFEKVFTFYNWKNRRRVIWKKFAPRAVQDVEDWEMDAEGGPAFVRMTPDIGGGQQIVIPIQKLLVFSYRREGSNIEGISAQREMYKHWYYKENMYKIDAIQKERHGIGIPVIKLPPNFTTNDKVLANELGKNLRTNEWAHITLPPMWEVEFAQVGGATVDTIQSIQHHDQKILDSMVGSFATSAGQGDAEVGVDIFMKFSRHIADIIREVINKYAIPELVSYNWPRVSEFPQLRARHIGQVADLRTMSFTIRNLVGAGALKPDDPLEDYLRNVNDLPRRDPDTEREAPTKQLPDGTPKQSQAGDMEITTGQKEGGDQSGG